MDGWMDYFSYQWFHNFTENVENADVLTNFFFAPARQLWMNVEETLGLTLTAYDVASSASSPMKKSRSSTPFPSRRMAWSPTFADSLMAMQDGRMNCGSVLPAYPILVYLQNNLTLLFAEFIWETWKYICIFFLFPNIEMAQIIPSPGKRSTNLTLCGLVMPYGDMKTGSTLAQIMACCLQATSHYLNQCWLIISTCTSKIQWLTFIWGQFYPRYYSHQSLKLVWIPFFFNF